MESKHNPSETEHQSTSGCRFDLGKPVLDGACAGIRGTTLNQLQVLGRLIDVIVAERHIPVDRRDAERPGLAVGVAPVALTARWGRRHHPYLPMLATNSRGPIA